jgi:hypothetical protein
MSALWILALGASIGYLTVQRQMISGRLDTAVKEWEKADVEPSTPAPPDGANFKEIKSAWSYTADTRNRDFNERLPAVEREKLLRQSDAEERVVSAFDQAGQSLEIEGVYLEQTVPF